MADIGSALNNRYEILGVISQGGLSTVYMAVDRKNNRTWAVKEIKTSFVGSEKGQKAAALMETMLASKLFHPSIPHIEEVFDMGEAVYIVMEYLAGRTLENTVIEFGPMRRMDAAQIGVRLCDVLGYLHSLSAPIIFCDLKPSNVMLMDRVTQDIKLFDFGAVRVYEEREGTDVNRFGTTGFTAPELIAGCGQVDTRADIYSLGAVLSFLITGKEPDVGRSSNQGLNDRETGGLETILRRCLEKNPRKRYTSCAEVRYDLEKCLVSEDLPGSLEKRHGCSGDYSTAGIGKTMKLGTTVRLGEERNVQEQSSGLSKQTIGFRPDINILVCDDAVWL